MFDPVNEPSFRLDVAGLSSTFEVLAFTGRETISQPFLFDVDLLIDDPALDLAGLLYRPATLHFGPPGNRVHGQLHELVQREHGSSVRLCQVRLGARLACLGLRSSQRVFSARSVPQILDQVLREHGIAGQDRRFELGRDYPLRDFCTQYRESDLQFVQRLCAQENIHYHFEHRGAGHCVVFGDGPGDFPPVETAVFRHEGGQPAVREFSVRNSAHSALSWAECRTDLPRLRSGQVMPLAEHPMNEWNQLWLLTHVEHWGCPDSLVPYRNTVHAMPWSARFESRQYVAKPRMDGLQRAWVVNVDESRPDPSRPVAVQFDWSYQGEGAAPGHCWLPLGPQLQGALSEGAEVVVSFIEGDPDQPLVTGVLYQPEPVEMPDEVDVDCADQTPPEGMDDWLRSSEPLLLLCLLPGGGSFNHCAQAICTCRVASRLGKSGAA